MSQNDIKNLSFQELTAYLKSIGEKSFRAEQIFSWIYKRKIQSFDAMSNVSAHLRSRLKEDFAWGGHVLIKESVAEDKTTKFLFRLEDDEKVETVLIPAPHRKTICVSTQAGCKFGCRFCASGIGGWSRNLTCAEIINQVLHVKNHPQKEGLSHIVFMGIGEPLDNYENLIKAIRIINSQYAVNIAARRITISTCGLIPKINQLAKEDMQVELAVSLHGSNNEARNILMPVNKKYPLKDLIAVCREYIAATKRQVTFEYILIKDLTCSEKAAHELGNLLKGMTCKINLIPYNMVEEFDHAPPSKTQMLLFRKKLMERGVHATIRMPRGKDVSAACGQLRYQSG